VTTSDSHAFFYPILFVHICSVFLSICLDFCSLRSSTKGLSCLAQQRQ
jgi:hypothetical protein